MSEKHYGADYLDNTGKILEQVKSASYSQFLELSSGTVIDLGCGTGQDVLRMAAQLPATVKITGLDHDPAMIAKAREQAAEQHLESRVEFMVSEAHQIPFGPDSVAGIRSERLIQHLKAPALVFDKIHEVLMPGAPLLILEADWTSLILYNGPLPLQEKLRNYLVTPKINNGYAARNMIASLKNKGFRNLAIKVLPFVFQSLQDIFMLLLLDQSMSEMKAQSLFTAQEYDEMMELLQIADREHYLACSMNMIMVTCNK